MKTKPSTYFELKEAWDDWGYFEYAGLTYKKGVNDNSANKLLQTLFAPMKIKAIEISPEVNQLRPFILPTKGFSMDEVMTLIQRTFNSAKRLTP